jgi:hypothetical protein
MRRERAGVKFISPNCLKFPKKYLHSVLVILYGWECFYEVIVKSPFVELHRKPLLMVWGLQLAGVLSDDRPYVAFDSDMMYIKTAMVDRVNW